MNSAVLLYRQNSNRMMNNKTNIMEEWMRELGLAMNITDCGADESMLEGMADACPITESGYVVLTREDVIDVLLGSLK